MSPGAGSHGPADSLGGEISEGKGPYHAMVNIVGHRGAAGGAGKDPGLLPEGSELGVAAVELDVQLTRVAAWRDRRRDPDRTTNGLVAQDFTLAGRRSCTSAKVNRFVGGVGTEGPGRLAVEMKQPEAAIGPAAVLPGQIRPSARPRSSPSGTRPSFLKEAMPRLDTGFSWSAAPSTRSPWPAARRTAWSLIIATSCHMWSTTPIAGILRSSSGNIDAPNSCRLIWIWVLMPFAPTGPGRLLIICALLEHEWWDGLPMV